MVSKILSSPALGLRLFKDSHFGPCAIPGNCIFCSIGAVAPKIFQKIVCAISRCPIKIWCSPSEKDYSSCSKHQSKYNFSNIRYTLNNLYLAIPKPVQLQPGNAGPLMQRPGIAGGVINRAFDIHQPGWKGWLTPGGAAGVLLPAPRQHPRQRANIKPASACRTT